MHLKIGLKDWNFVYHMVASSLKDWDKEFGIIHKALLKINPVAFIFEHPSFYKC